MKKNHINLFTPSLITWSIHEIIYAALFKDYIYSIFSSSSYFLNGEPNLHTRIFIFTGADSWVACKAVTCVNRKWMTFKILIARLHHRKEQTLVMV